MFVHATMLELAPLRALSSSLSNPQQGTDFSSAAAALLLLAQASPLGVGLPHCRAPKRLCSKQPLSHPPGLPAQHAGVLRQHQGQLMVKRAHGAEGVGLGLRGGLCSRCRVGVGGRYPSARGRLQPPPIVPSTWQCGTGRPHMNIISTNHHH